ncbi:MAG: NAD-dependent epimerase/dehydratase family protein [Candidatus Dormibacter sp.]
MRHGAGTTGVAQEGRLHSSCRWEASPVTTSSAAARRTVAVAGATGFVGRALVPRLIETGYAVRRLARRPEAPTPLDGLMTGVSTSMTRSPMPTRWQVLTPSSTWSTP